MSLEVKAVTKDFGATLKALRTARGWSQKELAKTIVLQIQFGAMKTICRNPRSTHCVLFRQFLECRYPFGRVR